MIKPGLSMISKITTGSGLHVSLSLPIDKASEEQWKLAAEIYLKEMGFDLEKPELLTGALPND